MQPTANAVGWRAEGRSPDVVDSVDEVCERPDERLVPTSAVDPGQPAASRLDRSPDSSERIRSIAAARSAHGRLEQSYVGN